MSLRRQRVVLGLDMHDFAEVDVGAKNVLSKMTLNAAIFTTPNPSMAVLLQQVTEYSDAHLDVLNTRARGAAALRIVKRDVLWGSLESERGCVQQLCDASPEAAGQIAASAGMRIAQQAILHRDVLTVAASLIEGPGGGKARKRTYLWRFSVDGGKTFVDAGPTPLAHRVVSGLPLGTLVGFQVAVQDGTGAGAWSQTTALFIH